MATLTITIPDDDFAGVTSDICLAYNYATYHQENETEEEFTKRMILTFVNDNVAAAHKTAASLAESAYTITIS